MNANIGMFIKYIKLDEEKRIIIAVQDHFTEYLKGDESRKMLKDSAQKILKSDFEMLEIGKNSCRITVNKENAENCRNLVETEIVKGIEMAMAFMNQMNNGEASNS